MYPNFCDCGAQAHTVYFLLFSIIQESDDLLCQIVLLDILIHRSGNHILPLGASYDFFPDLGAAHLFLPVIEEDDGAIAQGLQPLQLFVAPLVVDGEERGSTQRNIVVQDFGALNGIGNC